MILETVGIARRVAVSALADGLRSLYRLGLVYKDPE